jgi:hypothetical protein
LSAIERHCAPLLHRHHHRIIASHHRIIAPHHRIVASSHRPHHHLIIVASSAHHLTIIAAQQSRTTIPHCHARTASPQAQERRTTQPAPPAL